MSMTLSLMGCLERYSACYDGIKSVDIMHSCE